jgi:hypothetical protein
MGLLQGELVARFGAAQQPRIQRGLAQTARFWRTQDGGAGEYEAFVRAFFAGDGQARDLLFRRLETALADLEGRHREIRRDGRRLLDLEPRLPVDPLLAGYDPGAHLAGDWFQDRLAFVVLLNFPLTSPEERRRDGPAWSGRQWAEAWLAERFRRRAPAEVDQDLAAARDAAAAYVQGYRLRLHQLVDARGLRPFPTGPARLCHGGLRDELRAQYRRGRAGLARQRLLQRVLERIVDQTVPAAVIDQPGVDWDPAANTVRLAAVPDGGPAAAAPAPDPEPDTRYRVWLDLFQAERALDPWSPLAPTLPARRAREDRQLPEDRVRALLEEVCGSPLAARVARLAAARLGRPLEPFDLWYDGFGPGAGLDALARRRYPDAAAYRRDLPRLLRILGFAPDQVHWLAASLPREAPRCSLDAAPEAGPDQPGARSDPGGLDFQGFTRSLHRTGHQAEQCFARQRAPSPLQAGAPEAACAEALALLVQGRAAELLGATAPDARSRALAALDTYWNTYRTAGTALVDLDAWQWLYAHPGATPARFKEAVLACARSVWNRWFAAGYGSRDSILLAAHSHLVDGRLGLPDAPLGRLMACQIQDRPVRTGHLGPVFARLASQGRLTPDLWLERGGGRALGAGALLEATGTALDQLE